MYDAMARFEIKMLKWENGDTLHRQRVLIRGRTVWVVGRAQRAAQQTYELEQHRLRMSSASICHACMH